MPHVFRTNLEVSIVLNLHNFLQNTFGNRMHMMNEEEQQSQIHRPKIRSVKFNVAMNMILTSSSFIFPLITVPYASRVLGTHGTGAVAFAQSVISYFALFALMGISVYGVRECASVRDDPRKLSQTVQELLVILFCTTTVVYLIFLGALFAVPQLSSEKELMVIFSAGIWLSSFGVEWFYQAIEQYGYITVRNILFKLAALGLMFVLVRDASDYQMYGLVTVLAGYGSNVVNMFRLRKLVSFKKRERWNLKRHFKPMLSFTVSSISSGLYSQIDIVMLGFLGTTSMVGIYQLAFKIKNVLGSAIGSVGNVMLPRLSYFTHEGKKKEFVDLLAKNFSFIITSGLALTSICILCSNDIVLLLGGPEFTASAIPLRVISPILVISPLNVLLSQQMIATGREKTYASINFGTLLGAVALTFFCIPTCGIVGAGISVTAAEFVALVVRFLVLKTIILPVTKVAQIWKPIVACGLSFAGVVTLTWICDGDNPLMRIISYTAVFALAYILFLFLFREKNLVVLYRRMVPVSVK
jgi:O-antigen/teichoic acid export membrane protein